MKPEPTTLKENKECIHYMPYIYYNPAGRQCHTNRCRLIENKARCGTLRKNRMCPRKRFEYPCKHVHVGKQMDMGGYEG